VSGPLVGISAYAEQARWGPWDQPAALLPLSYAEQVATAGGVPVLLPPLPTVPAAVGRLDALVLSGGGDLDPAGYGAPPHPRTSRVQPGRDRAELAVLAAALAAGLPVLAICRGLQVLNVARGGTLAQHLPEVTGHDGHQASPGTFGQHPVRIAPGSRLAGLLGPPDPARGGLWLDVPTAHHQAIDRLGSGLLATAWAEDGTIEAVEFADRDEFLIAVQWHPEAGTDPRLFRALLRSAQAGANGKPGPAEHLDSLA